MYDTMCFLKWDMAAYTKKCFEGKNPPKHFYTLQQAKQLTVYILYV
jgi:hypothetical protein